MMNNGHRHEYGFLEESELPQGRISSDIMLPCQDVRWAVTTDFLDIARNHCAAVTVTNLMLYFENTPSHQVQEPDHARNIFTGVHDLVGNGPVFTIRRKAQRYARAHRMNLQSRPVKTCEDFAAAIRAGHPCALLLAQNLLHWHWVLCTGVRTYENTAFGNPGGGYLRIMDSWHRSDSFFYQPGRGSVLISAAEYWMEK